VRPLAYIATLPAGWVSAYYQNATVLVALPAEAGAGLSSRAWAQARISPWQNHAVLGILVFVFIIVWLNVTALLAAVPFLLKTFFGIETMASRSMESYMANGTFFTATFGLAHLLVSPLWRAAYVVRCFHGAALTSGADIIAGLQILRQRAPAALALVLCFGILGMPAFAAMEAAPRSPAAPTPASTAGPGVDSATLDRSISTVLERREFGWRSPRVAVPEVEKKGFVIELSLQVKQWIERTLRKIGAWFRKLFESKSDRPSSGSNWAIPPMESILYGAGAIATLLLLWAGWRYWSRPRTQVTVAQAVALAPDMEAADLTADQLPEDGWLALARDFATRGELRLALRAAYLAGLAYLGEHEFVSIARHKSNRDYQRELRRRARSREELLSAFDANLLTFERAWYGQHGVTLPMFEEFTRNLERIRAC
jgi:hypothetical protein